MPHHKGIHWLAPATMTAAFLAGVLLALGHDLFYLNLAGTRVSSGSFYLLGKSVPKQQFNTAVGTAFAFLVKAFLTVAISTAFIQILWRGTKYSRVYPTLAELDTVHSILDDILAFWHVKTFAKYPSLLLLAIVFWCVPIASVITPATLSAENTLHISLPSPVQVPQFDFTSLNFVAAMEPWYWYGSYNYSGPSRPVQRIAQAVSSLGELLPVAPPRYNSSWSQQFWGPNLQCHDVEGAEREAIWTNIWNSYWYTWKDTGTFVYLSWVPWSPTQLQAFNANATEFSTGNATVIDARLPFLTPGTGQRYNASSLTSGAGQLYNSSSSLTLDGPASIYVSVLPQMFSSSVRNGDFVPELLTPNVTCKFRIEPNGLNTILHDCILNAPDTVIVRANFTPSTLFSDATLVRCDLMNASYTASFKYTNGNANITVSQDMSTDAAVINTTSAVVSSEYSRISAQDNCSSLVLFSEYADSKSNCTFEPSVARLLSYQGISSGFNQLLQGYIMTTESPYGSSLNINTSAVQTILADTEELDFIQKRLTTYTSNFINLQSMAQHNPNRAYEGLVRTSASATRGPLKATLEEMFLNYTISLLTEPYLQPNYSSPFAPPRLTDVTFETYHNVYVYSRATLWIAYGLAILFTALAVAGGTLALFLNGASYSNNFSTIVRVSRAAEMSAEVMDGDGEGHEPLPKYLAEARFDTGSTGQNDSAADEKEEPVEQQRQSSERLTLSHTAKRRSWSTW